MSDPTGTCELVQFKVSGARFLHIDPRPRAGAPANLEQTLLQRVKNELEYERHSCGEGCECAVGEPVAVATRTQYKKVSDGAYTAWYQITLTKYRTSGECMPSSDPLPEGVRGA
jgi:hypothetical protein